VALGADVGARDVTACTPLQNAAHGTYSALAAMPAAAAPPRPAAGAPAAAAAKALLGAGGRGPAVPPPLTVTAAAAAAAGPRGAEPDGLIPVRTGLAWATLAGGGGGWGLDAADGPDADGGAERGRCGDWRDPAALALLRRAAMRRGGGGGGGAASGAAWPGAADVSLQLAAYAYGAPRSGERGGAGAADERAGGAGADAGLELFIRRSSEAWQLSSLEADRKRLVAVAERLVQLGAAVAAVDAEGRTALHLVRASFCVRLCTLRAELHTAPNRIEPCVGGRSARRQGPSVGCRGRRTCSTPRVNPGGCPKRRCCTHSQADQPCSGRLCPWACSVRKEARCLSSPEAC